MTADPRRRRYLEQVFDVVEDFAAGSRVKVSGLAISRTNLHVHSNHLEVVYVLQGALHVRVTIDGFDLDAGDFVVINRSDPHFLDGSADNVTAVISLKLPDFIDVDPFCEAVVFACESFGLARYRRQESLLRAMLLDIIEWGITGTNLQRLDERAAELVRLLCTGYSLENYYNRDHELSASQRERLLNIVGSIRANLYRRDVLDAVAREHHYSKSYVSHAVKDSCGVSFGDLVTGLRMGPAEIALLTTDATITEVSAACGFSHVKYFTRGFQDWVKQTPAEFRQSHRPETLRDNDMQPIPAGAVVRLGREHRLLGQADTELPRVSITPLLLKNVGSRLDLFDKIRNFGGEGREIARAHDEANGRNRHLVPIKVTLGDVDTSYLLDGLASFSRINATPCLVVEFGAKAAALELLQRLATRLRAADVSDMAVWLVCPGLHARAAVDQVVDTARDEYGLAVQAILMA